MTITNNHSTVYNTAKSEGASDTFAKIVLSQFVHESGNFTSNVFRKNNNPLGMKVPSKRKSPYILGAGTSAPTNEGSTPYARFASLADATRDLFHWLRYNKIDFSKIYSPAEYASILKSKGYYGDTEANYSNALSRFFNQFRNATFPGGGIAIVIFLVVAITLFYFLTNKNSTNVF